MELRTCRVCWVEGRRRVLQPGEKRSGGGRGHRGYALAEVRSSGRDD